MPVALKRYSLGQDKEAPLVSQYRSHPVFPKVLKKCQLFLEFYTKPQLYEESKS